jgi:hypothetical protein
MFQRVSTKNKFYENMFLRIGEVATEPQTQPPSLELFLGRRTKDEGA